jgi:hypothetical protein
MFVKLINDQSKSPNVISKILSETEDYRITLHDIGSNATVITFGYWGSGISQKGFGTDFCLKNGFNNIYVCCKGAQRFQHLSLDTFTDAVKEALKGKDVITYGLSLGGYAAIYYAAHIDARIVAFSPRNLSHPITPRIKQTFTHTQISQNPVSSQTPMIVLDPFDQTDFTFITKAIAPAYKKMHVIHIDNAGHSCFGAIKNSGQLKNFLLSLFAGKPQKIEVEDKYKVEFLVRKTQAYMHTPGRAEPYIRQLIELEPNRRTLRLAKEYIVNNNRPLKLPVLSTEEIRACLATLDNAFTEKSMAFDILTKTASVLEDAGQFETALSLYRLAIVKWPDSKRARQKIEILLQIINTAK